MKDNVWAKIKKKIDDFLLDELDADGSYGFQAFRNNEGILVNSKQNGLKIQKSTGE